MIGDYKPGMDPGFDRCLPFVLKEEGGNDDDPHDHGGRTSRGIIQKEDDRFEKEHGKPLHDVWTASDPEIHDIYYEYYWLPRCPKLAPGVDQCYFNICVNAGPGRAEKVLLGAVGGTDAETVNRMCDLMARFYRSLVQFPRYGKGWLGRTERCRAAALKMVGKSKEKTTMPTTTPPAVAASLGFNFSTIEADLETVAKFLPFIATVFPPAAIVLPFVPIIEGFLKMAGELQTAPHDPLAIANIVASHLHAIGDNVSTQAAALTPDPQSAKGQGG